VMYGDVERLMRIILRLLFYFSPVIYGLQDITARLGPAVSNVYLLNPLAGILDLYRVAFFPDQWGGWKPVVIATVVSIVTFGVGLTVFRRLEGTVLKEI